MLRPQSQEHKGDFLGNSSYKVLLSINKFRLNLNFGVLLMQLILKDQFIKVLVIKFHLQHLHYIKIHLPINLTKSHVIL